MTVSPSRFTCSTSAWKPAWSCRDTPAEDLQVRLQSLAGASRQALLDARNYIFDLKPMLEGEDSITEALQNQLLEFRSVTSIEADLTATGDERPIPTTVSAALLRIVQEGLANVYRHSQASKVDVALAFDQGLVRLEISDNGMGFTRQEAPQAIHGRGLKNMTQRAEELGGSLAIDSRIGEGTRLEVTIPLPPNGGGDHQPHC